MRRKMIAVVLCAAAVLTFYLGFQTWHVVAQSHYSQGLIVQTRLTGVQFVVDSAAVRRGYFTANLTFQNPTDEALNLMKLEAAYFQVTSHDSYSANALIAEGEINTAQKLLPGNSLFPVRIALNPYYAGNASLVPNTNWIIRYYPQLGLTACEMIATVEDSAIQTAGPYMDSSYNEPYTTMNTYILSIINAWAIGLEIAAVSLIIKPGTQKTSIAPRRETHDVMLSIIYGLQGVGFLAAPYYFSLIYVLVPLAPPDPYYIPYGWHGAGGILYELLLSAAFIAGLVFLVLAVGLFLRWNWAKNVATAFSALGIFGWLYIAVILLQSSAVQGFTVYNLMPTILFLVTVAANGIAVYVIWRRSPLPSQIEPKAPSVLTTDQTK